MSGELSGSYGLHVFTSNNWSMTFANGTSIGYRELTQMKHAYLKIEFKDQKPLECVIEELSGNIQFNEGHPTIELRGTIREYKEIEEKDEIVDIPSIRMIRIGEEDVNE